jgi:hypothetical protein
MQGTIIEARCTKCRKNTAHTVVLMEEENPAMVQCSACSRQHKYREPSAPRKVSVRAPVDPSAADRKEWAALRPNLDTARATDYSMTSAYNSKSLINHPVFGLGLVRRVVGPQKVEVLFEVGKKTMRCK